MSPILVCSLRKGGAGRTPAQLFFFVGIAGRKSVASHTRSRGRTVPGRILRYLDQRLDWHANRFEPAADVDLSVSLSAEMPRRRTVRCRQIPLDDGELLISAFNHKPTDRAVTGSPANLAPKF